MKERVTISVEPEALDVAREAVKSGRAPNVSAAVEESLTRAGKSQAIREFVAMREEEYGPISEEAREWARKELIRARREITSLTQER